MTKKKDNYLRIVAKKGSSREGVRYMTVEPKGVLSASCRPVQAEGSTAGNSEGKRK